MAGKTCNRSEESQNSGRLNCHLSSTRYNELGWTSSTKDFIDHNRDDSEEHCCVERKTQKKIFDSLRNVVRVWIRRRLEGVPVEISRDFVGSFTGSFFKSANLKSS